MKIVDARSGEVMTPGKVVPYGGGEKIRVVDAELGFFRARALVQRTYRDYSRPDRDALVTTMHWVPLSVRFMHPSYMFERVAFIPS